MTRVLSIQSETMGHRVYAETLRACFQRTSLENGLQYDDFWTQDGRSLPTRLVTRLASLRAPLLSAKERDLDFGRVRIEWAAGRMSRILAGRKIAERKQTPYDVLYFHTQVPALGAEALMRAVPSVVSMDMTAFQVARGRQFPFTVRPNIARERRVFGAAAHIVTWSDWAARSVVEDYGVAPEKVTVISPGVRFWELAPVEVVARPMQKLLFMGSDFARKGGWDLLDVFQKNFSDRCELHLVTSQPLGDVGRNVFVHNGVAAYSPEWQTLLAGADIFVLPSSFEAFGLVLQEAAAFGAALVGTHVGGIPQMVREGENGFLLEPGNRQQLEDRLRRLVEDDALRLRFRQRSRALALAEFDAEKNARRLGELFQSVKR